MSDTSNRKVDISRKTKETSIEVSLDLDGSGKTDISTGIGFFDHMLEAFGRHGLFDLRVKAEGDLEVDAHHTVEDVGIVLGQAFDEALGDKRGIRRFASLALPMDEALVLAAVDISGRGLLCWDVELVQTMLGAFDSQLAKEFFIAFARNARLTLHLKSFAGENTHHIIEACFKSCARVMREACELDPRAQDALPSTKGLL
ncbi:MAG: imidazoleglycerol-phosphate dehydratase HisB [Eggerthellaceae bacterium]|jgi:imidazoleglycerol-phosphate dehydratase